MEDRFLKKVVRSEAFHWGDGADKDYFEIAEQFMDMQWREMIYPFLKDVITDRSCALELAAGRGRNTQKLSEHFERVVAVDVNPDNIKALKRRFSGNRNISVVRNNGYDLRNAKTESVAFVYCFDSMVHFDMEIVMNYLREFERVLKPGGLGFVHHSNYTARPESPFTSNPEMRNFMSEAIFAHLCFRSGLAVIKQSIIDWGSIPGLDCLTLFQKKRASSRQRAGAKVP